MTDICTPQSIPFLGVTREGQVYNLISGKELSFCDNGHGYKQVFIMVKGKRYVRYIHRLVAECYIPNPDGLPEVNHKDGNKANNHADNLEWCTSSYNKYHALRLGLKKPSERQRQVAREYGKKNIHLAQEGWKSWAQTDTAREQWMKNLEKADRWGTRNEPAEVKANRRREKKKMYRETHREELRRKTHERYMNMTDEQRARRTAKRKEREAQRRNDLSTRQY